MAAPRLRKVMTKKEMDNLIDDYVTQGYEILEQGERSALVRKVSWGTVGGHVLWALLNSVVYIRPWQLDICPNHTLWRGESSRQN